MELGAKLDRREFEQYEKHLKDVREKVARKERYKAQLGADFNPRAFAAYERELKKADRHTDSMVKSQGRLRTAFGSVWGKGGAAFAAAGGAYAVVTAVKSVVSAYGEAEASSKRVQTAVENVGLSYQAHRKEIDKTIAAQSRLSAFDDEDLADSFAKFVTSTKSVNEALKLNQLAADVARGRQISLQSAMRLVLRASQGNAAGLKRLGLEVDPVTKATDKLAASHKKSSVEQSRAAKETDKIATGSKAVAALQKQFGGQAAAYGRTQQGAIEKVSVAWENLREKIGEKLAPTITDIARKMSRFIDEMDAGTGQGGKFVDELEKVWAWLKRAGDRVKDVAEFLKDHKREVELAAAAWVTFKGAIFAANTVAKASTALSVLTGGRIGAGTAARAAGTSAAGTTAAAGGGGLLARVGTRVGVGGVAAGVAGAVVAAGSVKAISDAIKGGDASDVGLLDKYARSIERLAKAGDAAGMRKLAGQLRETATANRDITKGRNLNAFADVLDKTAKSGGKDLSGLAGAFRALGKTSGSEIPAVARDVQRLARTTKPDLKSVAEVTDTVRSRFEQFESRGGRSLRDLRSVVKNNVKEIRTSLGSSKAGTDAMADNFSDARSAVRRAMRDGKISVQAGLKEIRRLMRAELVQLGITNLRGEGPQTAAAAEGAREQIIKGRRTGATGGWLGTRGMVGGDTIPAMLAPGEAVLNRHQQGVIEGLLGDGFLDRLFATVNRPHFMAGGGRVTGDTDYLPALGRALEAMSQATGVPISVASGRRSLAEQQALYARYLAGTGNLAAKPNANAPHVRGIAADISPGRERFGSVAARFGLGFTVPSESWHIELLGAVGRALAGAIPGAGAVWKAIKTPQTTLTGMLGDIVQGTLTRTTRLANRRGRALAATVAPPGGEPAPGAVSGAAGSTADVRSIFYQALKLAGIPPNSANINKLVTLLNKENRGHSATITNPISVGGEHATGWMQMLPSTFRANAVTGHTNINDPIDNAAASIRYQIGRYGGLITHSPYARGGFLRRFAKGKPGKPSKLVRTVGGASAGLIRKIRPLQTDSSPRLTRMLAHTEAWDADYSRWERRFNTTDEEFVDTDTGEIDFRAIQRKVTELGKLIDIRERIEAEYKKARAFILQTIASYRRVIRSLRRSLAAATKNKKKNRKGIQSYINQYQARVGEWKGKLGEVDDSLFDTRTDLKDLRAEYKDIYPSAQRAYNEAHPTPDAADTSDTGAGDTTGAADTGEPAARPPTALEIAEGVAAEMRTRLSTAQEMFAGFGGNALTRQQAFGAGGAFSGAPDEITSLAGLRNLGGASNIAGSLGAGRSGALVVVQDGGAVARYTMPIQDPATHTQQLRNIIENGLGG